MNKTKPKVRKVKAWAVIGGEGWGNPGQILYIDDLHEMIFLDEESARRTSFKNRVANYDVVPVTITYTLPKPSKKKTK